MPIKSITIPYVPVEVMKKTYMGHKYFLKKYAEMAGIEIKYTDRRSADMPREVGGIYFCAGHIHMLVDGKSLFINYSDHDNFLAKCDYTFKTPEIKYIYSFRTPQVAKVVGEGREDCIYPLGSVLTMGYTKLSNFMDMVREKSIYTCNSNIILHKQALGEADGRRKLARKILIDSFGDDVSTEVRKNDNFWFFEQMKNCLTSVCIPGARPDMLDRGMWEQMGLGVCTIAPPITTEVCWKKNLIGGEHYVQIKPDFSDLPEKIEWCKEHRKECREIGENAKEFFKAAYLPENLWRWIEHVLDQHY